MFRSHVCGCMRDGMDASYVMKLSQHVKAVAVCVITVQENKTIHAVTRHF